MEYKIGELDMKKFLKSSKKFINLTLLTTVIGAGFGVYASQGSIDQELIKGFSEYNLMKPGHYKVGKSYKIKDVKYTPKSNFSYKEEGLASWYGPGFDGKKTANGETFDMESISAAHKTLQMPCVAKVTNLENGKVLMVRINDRGPFHKDNRIIDLSKAAAEKLGFKEKGVAKVRVEVMTEESIQLAANCQGKEVSALQRELKLAQNNKQKRSSRQV